MFAMTSTAITTNVHEIADGVYRLSTLVPEVAPGGFTFNQFLVTGDEPMLFHTGGRGFFPLVAEAISKIVPLDSLRWISFGHVEADECGAMNLLLAAAPHSAVVFNPLGCDVSLNDLCDRPPEVRDDGTSFDIGGHVLTLLATPHVPHGWEAQVMFDETTRTLFCGDLFSQIGGGPAIVHDDIVGPALDAEDLFHATALSPTTAATLRWLAQLEPRTLAVMHGASFAGDGAQALRDLADAYEQRVAAALAAVPAT
jgi:flavorubredoxin